MATARASSNLTDASAPARPPSGFAAAAPASTGTRIWTGLFALAILVVLCLSAWLSPTPAGYGTHEQLGLRPCTWAQAFGRPCATCGMTTSFAHAANLDFRSSFTTQPMGMLLAVFAATLVWPLGYIFATGSKVGTIVVRAANGKTAVVFTVLMLLAWAYKVVTWPTN